ncbi:MAG: FixH family protein [Acidobacteriota bacterium]
MNHFRKKIILAIMLITSLLATSAFALAAEENAKTAGPYHIVLTTQPEMLMSNKPTTISVILTDKLTGKPVTGAKVQMKSTMMDNDANMSGDQMSLSMDKPEQVIMHSNKSYRGQYTASITLSDPGQWNQTFNITSRLGPGKITFPISVDSSGPNYIFIGVIAGMIFLAGILASMLKKRKPHESGGTSHVFE